jgi:hypothetical protein
VETGVNGFIVPFDDPSSFVARTLACAADPELRALVGLGARETILETMDVPVTSQGVHDAYDVAIAQFRARHTAERVAGREVREMPPNLLERSAILEELVWAEALMLQGQRALGLRIIRITWVRHPLSSLPPRFLFRNLLPQPLVRALMRAKVGARGSSR